MSPLQLFQQWHTDELEQSNSEVPSACCLSTNGLDGYPNTRFVDLKEVNDEGFVITTSLRSRKALEIAESSKVSLTFWWAHRERQVRIQGDAQPVAIADADVYFSERHRTAQLISVVSKQGLPIENIETLLQEFQNMDKAFAGTTVPRPDDWGGFLIIPIRIEFMQFRANRFHERTLFTKQKQGWTKQLLQP
jgi:pyridoxamine 5'-phosphate oxidase